MPHLLGYALAYEAMMPQDEQHLWLYLAVMCVRPDVQRTGIGWRLFCDVVRRARRAAYYHAKPVRLTMHLRSGMVAMLEKHAEELEARRVRLCESVRVSEHQADGTDAEYRVYEVRTSSR